jgi:hypothetical protein
MTKQSDQMVPDDTVMRSRKLIDDLVRECCALCALDQLFAAHGRRPFKPSPDDLASATFRQRGGRQHLAHAISLLHVRGYLRWLPGGRYRIISREILTAAELRAQYPNAEWHNGFAWTEGRPSHSVT